MLNGTVSTIKQNAMFDLAVLEQTIEEIKNSSYQNLLKYQQTMIEIKRFDLTMSQLIPMQNVANKKSHVTKKYIGQVKTQFIHDSKRLAFKRSSFYNTELDVYTISKNPKLFLYNYMVFIDGKFIDSINIVPSDGVLSIVFDVQNIINPVGIPSTHFDSLLQSNAQITVLVMTNTAYGTYNTTRLELDKYKQQLSLQSLNIAGNLSSDSTYLTFVNNSKLLFGSVITDTTNSANMLRFVNNSALPSTGKNVHLNVFGFKNLQEQKIITGATKFFRLTGYAMPIPASNILIFKNAPDGTKTFAHGVSLVQYYSNVYEIIGNDANADLTVYVFYAKETANSIVKLNNELAVYEKFAGTSVTLYANGQINPVIKNFVPNPINYSIEDFKSSPQYPDHLAYKLNKVSTWIDANPELLKTYLSKELQTQSGYYIDTSLLNMTTRVRANNSYEIKNVALQESFTESRYLFILKNEAAVEFDNFRFYIDGNMHIPDKQWFQNGYNYVYIKQSLVPANAVIEIERFAPKRFLNTVSFSSVSENEQMTVDLVNLCRNDIMLVDPATNLIVPAASYTVSYFDEKGVKTGLGNDSFKVIPNGTFVINMKDTLLLNKPIDVYVLRSSHYQIENITGISEAGKTFVFTKEINPDARHFRIFRNGRLLPQSLYEIDSSKSFKGASNVTPLVYKEIGDTYIIDYTPNKYKVAYEQTTVPTNGVVDLRGKINRPLDLTWYDVYLNGRRLSKKNIEWISSYIIIIKNVTSLKNLSIVERDKDLDFFKIASGSKTIIENLWDVDATFKTAALAGRPAIPDSEIDVISELITETGLEMLRFFNRYLSLLDFVNPDVMQLDDIHKEEFPNLFIGNVLPIDPDKDFNPRSYVMLIHNP